LKKWIKKTKPEIETKIQKPTRENDRRPNRKIIVQKTKRKNRGATCFIGLAHYCDVSVRKACDAVHHATEGGV
jgi:hypothetical protein